RHFFVLREEGLLPSDQRGELQGVPSHGPHHVNTDGNHRKPLQRRDAIAFHRPFYEQGMGHDRPQGLLGRAVSYGWCSVLRGATMQRNAAKELQPTLREEVGVEHSVLTTYWTLL